MRIAALIILLIECIIIIPLLGKSNNIVLSDEKITTFMIIVLFIINCIISLIYLLVKQNKRLKKVDGIMMLALLSIIIFIPINSLIISNKQQNHLNQRKEHYKKRMGNTLTPFYQGDGSEDERRVQNLREKFVDFYTREGKTFTAYAYDDQLICPQIKHSFVTEDKQYIILTCQYSDNTQIHYAHATEKEGTPIKYFTESNYLENRRVSKFPYQGLLSKNDFSKIYIDPIDGTQFGNYKGSLYLIPQHDNKDTDVKLHVSDKIIQFQKENESLFTDDRIIKLATHLLSTNKCQTVNDTYLFNDDYLIIGCETDSYAFNYQQFANLDFGSLMLIKLPQIDNSDLENHVVHIINACSETNQANLKSDTDYDAKILRQALVNCENDNVWPYKKCMGIYYKQLSETDFGSYLKVDIVHVKNETLVSPCIVSLSDQIAAQVKKIIN